MLRLTWKWLDDIVSGYICQHDFEHQKFIVGKMSEFEKLKTRVKRCR